MSYETMNPVQIGEALKNLREEKAITMEQEASDLGISTSAVAMYENGNRIPRDEIKIRIAEYFNLPVESIFFPKKQHEMC